MDLPHTCPLAYHVTLQHPVLIEGSLLRKHTPQFVPDPAFAPLFTWKHERASIIARSGSPGSRARLRPAFLISTQHRCLGAGDFSLSGCRFLLMRC